MSDDLQSLCDVTGEEALLVRRLEASDADTLTLYEYGFVEGARVRVIQRGDPAIVQVGTGTVAVAASLARAVRVSRESAVADREYRRLVGSEAP